MVARCDMVPYPATASARNHYVINQRGGRARHDPWRHQAVIAEDERTAAGDIARVGTVFLTGRECPWHCVMCDLWQYTIEEDTPERAIPAQVGAARRELVERGDAITAMKLYNAGSFFDPRAVPEGDYDEIASEVAGLGRVIVESHPALIGPRVDALLQSLDRERLSHREPVRLEVAMGLETAHPHALELLNKQMTVGTFTLAARELRRRDVALRVFLLISPPFVPPAERDVWLLRSIDIAFSCGASVISLVPTRSGNGALDTLASEGSFQQPHLADIERSIESALSTAREHGRVFVDLWDLERFADCGHCLDARRTRLHAMNLEQRVLPSPSCTRCGAGRPS